MHNATLERIRTTDPQLAAKIESQGYCVTKEDLPKIIRVNRGMMLLVRTGQGRFLAPADCVEHFVKLIDEHREMAKEKTGDLYAGDHVRDVSLPAS